MRKTILIILCIILLATTVYAFPFKKSIIGYEFNITYAGSPSNVEVYYNYTDLLSHIDDEDQVYVCKWFQQYDRWIPMRDAIKNLTKNTVTYYINQVPQQWALCLINDSAACEHPPNATTFDPESTDFDSYSVSQLDALPDVVLKKNSGTINWSASTYDVCGAPLDDAVNTSGSHASMDAYILSPTLDSEAIVTLEDVNCLNFNLYYAPDYYTVLQDIIDNGTIVADETTVGDCSDSSVCAIISCVGNTLTFTAKHFDSFGEEQDGGGDPAPIPEFSVAGLILTLLILAVGITVIIKTRK